MVMPSIPTSIRLIVASNPASSWLATTRYRQPLRSLVRLLPFGTVGSAFSLDGASDGRECVWEVRSPQTLPSCFGELTHGGQIASEESRHKLVGRFCEMIAKEADCFIAVSLQGGSNNCLMF